MQPTGLALDARNVVPGEVATWVATAHGAGVVAVLDPVSCLDQSPASARPAGYAKTSYGNHPPVTAPFADDAARRGYVQPIIAVQRAAGVDAVIAPYLYSEPSRRDMLEESLRLGSVAQRVVDDDASWTVPVWTAIAISDAWARPPSLPALLAEITRFGPITLYVSVATAQSTAQPLADAEVLLGLRTPIEQVNAYGGEVIFGRRYSSGLLLCALGAAGWTTGTSGTHHTMFVPPSAPSPSGGPGADWYYVPTLLNSLKIPTRAGLVGAHAALLAPTDQYDSSLFANNPTLAAIGGNTQQRILLHQHNLNALRNQAKQLASISPAQRIRTMRAMVFNAMVAYASLGAGLDPGEEGDFLVAWQSVL